MDDLQKYIEKRKLQNKDFAENFDKGYEEFKNKELKNFNISEYLDSKEIKDEYLAQVLKEAIKMNYYKLLKILKKPKLETKNNPLLRQTMSILFKICKSFKTKREF